MTFYAVFDHTQPAPQPVTGWLDTASVSYPQVPDAANLLQLTPDQWTAHLVVGQFAINNGTLVSYTPPPPVLSLAQQASAAMYAGLTIALTGAVTLVPTLFPTDPDTQRKLAAVCTNAAINGSFPGGSSTFPLRDSAGTWHSFTWAAYKQVASAIAAYAAALDLIADGNPLGATALPPNTVTLTV